MTAFRCSSRRIIYLFVFGCVADFFVAGRMVGNRKMVFNRWDKSRVRLAHRSPNGESHIQDALPNLQRCRPNPIAWVPIATRSILRHAEGNYNSRGQIRARWI